MQYSQEILSLIQNLELQRLAEVRKFGSIALVVVALAFLIFFKFRSSFLPYLLVGFIVLIGSFYMLNSNYMKSVKSSLLPKLVKAIDKDFDYSPDVSIDVSRVNDLKYFSHNIGDIESSGTISIEDAKLSFVKLNSVKVDTEEGEHESLKFDGAVLVVDGVKSDQNYLIVKNSNQNREFEAGDNLNVKNMDLKPVKALKDGFKLLSADGKSTLNEDMIEKVIEFTHDLEMQSFAIFSKDKLYIFVDGMQGGFDMSLFKSLKESYFIGNYSELLKRVKKVIAK
jgi:hypothetical protein